MEPCGPMTGREGTVCQIAPPVGTSAVRLVHSDIIKEGKGWIASEVIVAIGQGEGVGMARNHAGRHLNPRVVVGTGPRQNGSGCSSRVIPERCGCPVKLDSIRACDQVPEAQRAGSAGSRERLRNRAIAVGRRGRTRLRGKATRVRPGADRGRSAPGPAGKVTRLETAIGDTVATATRGRDGHCHGGAMRDAALGTCDRYSI